MKEAIQFDMDRQGTFVVDRSDGYAWGTIRGNKFNITYEKNWLEINVNLKNGEFRRFFVKRQEKDATANYIIGICLNLLKKINRDNGWED